MGSIRRLFAPFGAKHVVAVMGNSTAVATGGAAPLQYLSGAGAKAFPVVNLTWGVLLISVAVIVIIAALLLVAIFHRPGLVLGPGEKGAVGPDKGGLNGLWIGVGISTLVLFITVGWTVAVLARIEGPGSAPRVTIEVTGRQWWWQVRYLDSDPSRIFTTANEIHIPAGEPVRLRLVGGDVIHSFWVPQLAGKTDTIPGQTNETWIEAARPGIYNGQCTEYCGVQHSHMAVLVIADSPADFEKWRAHQLQPAADDGGAALFVSHCGGCHTVRGTDAAGNLGPDLSHFATRTTLGSAILPNDRATLAHWIADPQNDKPGVLMPAPQISGDDLTRITTYLQTLN